MNRTTIGALTLALGLSLVPRAVAQSVHLERVPGVFRDLVRSPGALTLPLEGDEEGLLVQLGFSFSYYGQTFTQLGVTTNGYVTVGTAVGPDNDALPSAALPNGVLAPFWDDLDTRPNPDARIYMERVGAPGARVLTIQWSGLALKADPAARLTFQVLIFEGTNEVLFHYGPMKNGDGSEGTGRASGSSATIGVESPDGSAAVPVAFNQPGVARPGLGYAFLPRAGAPLPEGRRLGDLDGDGRVTILDQSRQVELTSARYRPASSLELVAADVAPLDSHGALWGDGTLRVSDRDLISQVIVERVTLAPYLSDLQPGAVAPLATLTVIGSGFDASSAGNNVVVLPRSGGGTLEVAAATVNATGSRLTLSLPQDARRGPTYVKVGTRRTNERTLSVAGLPAILAIAPAPAVIGETLAIGGLEFPLNTSDVQVTIGGLPATVLTITAGPDTGLGATRIATVQIPAELTPGSHAVVVATGTRVSEPVTHTFGDLPIVAITSPTADAVITDRFTVTGTVQDADLARYELAYAPLEGGEWVTFFTGTGQVTDAALGTFDPTLLLNGYYRLRLKAIDVHGLSAEDEVSVSAQGWLKLGHFTLSFTDLEVPVSGIALRVVREYDSRDKVVRDFGVGWRLRLVSVDLQEGPDHSVILDNPSSGRVEYTIDLEPDNTFAPRFYTVSYQASDPRERSTIDFETPEDVDDGNHILAKDGVGNLFWFPEAIPFDPQVYRVTMLDRTVLRVHDENDLLQVLKPDGNSVTITSAGILHSSGKSVRFVRDGLRRITKVIDPRESELLYAYDAAGDLVHQTDAEGFATTFTYRSDHHMLEWFDARGVRAQKNEYDDDGRLAATVDPFGKRIEFGYDLVGRRAVVLDKLERPTISAYDARGRVTEITTPDGLTEAMTYNALDKILTRRDRRGNTWTFDYDSKGNQTSQTDPLGNTIEYTYDADGHVLTIKDADGGLWVNTYSPLGKLVTSRDPLGRETTRTHDANGNLTSITDPVGNVTRVEYDGFGNVTRRVEPHGRVTLYTSDPNGNASSATEITPVPGQSSARSTTTYQYDRNDYLTKLTLPDGQVIEQTWGPGGRLAERTDSALRVARFEYDDLGRLARRRFADDFADGREYDANGLLTAIEDRDGRRTCTLDERGQVTQVTFADGSTLECGWDGNGNLVSRRDGRGSRWQYEYDAANRRTKQIDPTGAETTFGYDGRGNLTTSQDADGRTTTFVFDEVGRHVKTVLHDGTEERLERDEAGRLAARVDAFNRTTRFVYGQQNARERIEIGSSATLLTYDTRGNPLTRTDPNGHVYTHRYDPITGQEVARALPLGAESTREYDPLGYLNAFTNFNGDRVELDRDGAGNLVFRAFPDGTGERLRYDASHRLTQLEDLRGTTQFERDAIGRLVTQREPDGRALSYEYDGNANVTKVIGPAGSYVTTYDGANRPTTLTAPTGGQFTFDHTPGGVLERVTYPNGVTTEIAVDARGRLTRIAHQGPSGPLAGFTYTYGADGNRSRAAEDSGRTVDYGYDELGRLTSELVTDTAGVTSRAYAFDLAGNRLQRTTVRPDGSLERVTCTYDDDDRLLREAVEDSRATPSAWQVVYTHDAAGNTLSRTAPGRDERYAYDAISRLVSATVTVGDVATQVRYRYDHQGRRVETVRDGVVTRHLVDGNRPLSQLLVDTDANGAVLATYTMTDRMPLGRTNAAGEAQYLLLDGQLSARLITDANGAVIGSVDYDAFGEVTSATGATGPLVYGGDVQDPETGLYHLRSRYLDPRAGRFMTRDTFDGFTLDPPTLHAYVYALQNPVNRIDPAGTYSFDLNSLFCFDIPSFLSEITQANQDRRMKHWENISLLRAVEASIYDFGLSTVENLIGLDVRKILLGLFPPPAPPEPVPGPARAPLEPAITWLYGAKIYGRMGPDLVLTAGDSASGSSRTPQERLAADARLYTAAPQPPQDQTEAVVAAQGRTGDLLREIVTWLNERRNGGAVEDIRVKQYQVDADGNQVGWNTPDVQFVMSVNRLRFCIQLVGSGAAVSQMRRVLLNDPRCAAIEVNETASLDDVKEAVRNNGDVGLPADRFIPRPGSGITVYKRVFHRNLPQEPAYNAGSAGQGVVASTGEFVLSRTDMALRGVGLNWELARTYRSGVIYPDDSDFFLGHNWSLNYDERMIESEGREVRSFDEHGRIEDRYTLDHVNITTGFLKRPRSIFDDLLNQVVDFAAAGGQRQTVEGYLRRSPDGLLKKFNRDRWLVEVSDRYGNKIQLLRDSTNRLITAIDSVGREIQYQYSTFTSPGGKNHDLLVRVTVGDRVVHYDYDGSTLDLIAAVSPEGSREEYSYSEGFLTESLNHNLLTIVAPNEIDGVKQPSLINTYNDFDDLRPSNARDFAFDRVIRQRLGGFKDVLYADGSAERVEAGGELEYVYTGAPGSTKQSTETAVRDRRGYTTRFFFNEDGNPVRVVDEAGYETTHAYNAAGLRIHTREPSGRQVWVGYDEAATKQGLQGNKVFEAIVPAPRELAEGEEPPRTIVTQFAYEPVFNQLQRVTDANGLEPVYGSPPVAGINSATWPLRGPDFDAYSTVYTYDYQEGDTPPTQALQFDFWNPALFPIGMELNLGDLNRDGRRNGVDDRSGNLVHVRGHRVSLEAGSHESNRLGGVTTQESVTLMTYDRRGQPVDVVDAEGNHTSTEYYADTGYARTITRDTDSFSDVYRTAEPAPPTRVTISFEYDAFGNVTNVRDGRGIETLREWTKTNLLRREVRAANEPALRYEVLYEYDKNGNLARVLTEDRGSHVPTAGLTHFVSAMSYDLLDNQIETAVQLASGSPGRWLSTRTRFDPGQLPERTIYPEGNVVAYGYDGRGLMSSLTRGFGSSRAATQRWFYDESRNLIEERQADGESTLTTYDGFNRTLRVTQPTGNFMVNRFDAVGNLVSASRYRPGVVPTLFERTTFVKDQAYRTIRVERALFDQPGGPERLAPVTTRREFDRLGRVSVSYQADGGRTFTRYDGLGRVRETEDELGNLSTFTYDANDNVVGAQSTEQVPGETESFVTTTAYDALDRPTRVTDNAGQTVYLAYDSRSNLVSIRDPRGPLGADASPADPFVGQINLSGNLTRSFYDAANRLVRTEQELRVGGSASGALELTAANPDGLVTTTWAYDDNSRVESITDDRGNPTRYAYDELNRVASTTHADGTTWTYEYDGDDNLTRTTDPNGNVVVRHYDGQHRPTQVDVTRALGVEGTTLQTFAWDALSRLTGATDDNGGVRPIEVTRAYDSLSRLTRETQDGRSITSGYDDDGNRLSCEYPSGLVVGSSHDVLDRLETVGVGSPPLVRATYSFRGPSRLAARQYLNGTSLTITDELGQPGWDAVKRLTALRHVLASTGGAIVSYGFEYDRAGNRTASRRHHDSALSDEHEYDSINRVVATRFDVAPPPPDPDAPPPPASPLVPRGLRSRTYQLDGAGNRASMATITSGVSVAAITTYVSNEVNAYTSIGGVARAYDANGNLKADGSRQFFYDAFNRLVRVRTATHETRYAYDASGRRLESTTRALPDEPSTTITFLYDGIRCVEERTLGGPADGERREYVHGAGLDEILATVHTRPSVGVSTYFHHEDASGSTVALTDANGAVVDRVLYDEFGVPSYADATAHAAVGNPHLFQGLRLAESGLYYARARFYDPTTGHFLQRDPIGVWGDPLNLGNPYTFAGNNPLTMGDPLGLQSEEIQLADGFQSAAEELTSIRAERAVASSSWLFQIGWTFSDRANVSGIIREKELEGTLSEFKKKVDATANSWQGKFARIVTEFNGTLDLKGMIDGVDPMTGQPLSPLERALAVVGVLAPDPLNSVVDAYQMYQAAAAYDEMSGEEFDNCFVAGTLVAMADGTKKPIEEVRAGDRVKAGDPLSGEVVNREVVRTFRNVTDSVVDVTWAPLDRVDCTPVGQRGRGERHSVGSSRGGESGEDGEPPLAAEAQTVRCTAGHPWWVESQQRWVFAGDLRVGDLLKLDDGRAGVVLALEVREEVAKTFNFEVEGLHTYFVGGGQGSVHEASALVHNMSKKAKKPKSPKTNKNLGELSRQRTPKENAEARRYWKQNKQKGRDAYEERTEQKWPTDPKTGRPQWAEHPKPLKQGGDPLFVEPGVGPDPNAIHSIVGLDGLTDHQRWGALGPLAKKKKKKP